MSLKHPRIGVYFKIIKKCVPTIQYDETLWWKILVRTLFQALFRSFRTLPHCAIFSASAQSIKCTCERYRERERRYANDRKKKKETSDIVYVSIWNCQFNCSKMWDQLWNGVHNFYGSLVSSLSFPPFLFSPLFFSSVLILTSIVVCVVVAHFTNWHRTLHVRLVIFDEIQNICWFSIV